MPFKFAAILAVLAVMITGCKKEFDKPPIRTLPVGHGLTVAELRSMFSGEPIRFVGDSSVFAVVTADEQNGNLYKNIFVQDHTGAIQLRMVNPGGLYQGDSIRIHLPGTILSSYNGMLQLDSVDVDNNVVKQATLVSKQPQTVTLEELLTLTSPAWNHPLQGKLVRLDSVEFSTEQLGMTYANAVTQQTRNLDLKDCDNNSVLLRTSGYSNFAGTVIPQGRGTFIGVVSQFNNDIQLYIRNVNEVQMNGPRCDGSTGEPPPCEYNVQPTMGASMNFDEVTSDNVDFVHPEWLNIAHIGSRVWRGRMFQSDKYLRATSFGSGVANQMWFISPPIINTGSAITLSFRSATANWNTASWPHPLTVRISTNFDGCNVDDATWTTVTGYTASTNSTPNYSFVNSGNVNISSFLQGQTGNVHIAFIYNGSGATGGVTTTLDLDDIVISQ